MSSARSASAHDRAHEGDAPAQAASQGAREDLGHRHASADLGVPLQPRALRPARRRRRRAHARGGQLVRARAALAGEIRALQARAAQLLAERAKAAGISEAVFDRGGYRYHGHVRAFAEADPRGGHHRLGAKAHAAATLSLLPMSISIDRSVNPPAWTSRSAWSRSTASPRSSRAAGASRSPRWWSSATNATSWASATARPTRCRWRSRRASSGPRRISSACPSTAARSPTRPPACSAPGACC